MSDFDRRVGHYRRYPTKTLRAAFGQAGLAIDRLHYVNAPGLPSWIVDMRLLRMTPGDGRLLRVRDRLVIPAARRAESGGRRHLGSPCWPSAACGPNPSI
jgi:hypothetical protein